MHFIVCLSSKRQQKRRRRRWGERAQLFVYEQRIYVLILSLIIGVSRSCIIFEDVLCVFTAFTLFIVIPKHINVF